MKIYLLKNQNMIKVISTALLILISMTACNSTKNKDAVMEVKNQTMKPISTTIASSKTNYTVGESVQVSFKAQNNTQKEFTFLPWGSPLENRLTGDCFEVTYMNNKLPYRGIMVKRMAPTAEDNITIEAGKTTEGKVTLNKAYDFSNKGKYVIQYKESHLGLAASNKVEIEIK